MRNEAFWRDFINLYRSLPATWRVKSDVYKNRVFKQDGYLKLTEKLKEIDPTADVGTAKKRINTLRSNYRRELKKVLASEKSRGAGTNNVYVPSVWYFDELEFLRAHEIQISATSTMDEDNEETFLIDPMRPCPQEKPLENTEDIYGTSPPVTTSYEPLKKTRKIGNSEENKNDLLELACKYLQKSTLNTDILVKTWAIELNKLEPDQQLFAQKAINNILFEARLKTLHRNSVTINHSCVCTRTSTPIYLSGNSNSSQTPRRTSNITTFEDAYESSGKFLSDPQNIN